MECIKCAVILYASHINISNADRKSIECQYIMKHFLVNFRNIVEILNKLNFNKTKLWIRI